jgi:transcription termination factor Rho
MFPTQDRASLEAQELADLHHIASAAGIEGFRRLRKQQLVEAILERQGGAKPSQAGGGRGRSSRSSTSSSRQPRQRRERQPRQQRREEVPVLPPQLRFSFGSPDETLKMIDSLTPIGRGSRALLVGGPMSGKTEALRRIASALSGIEGLDVRVVLTGARPEELDQWKSGPARVVASPSLTQEDLHWQAIRRTLSEGERVATGGRDAAVIIDSLDTLPRPQRQRALAAGRNFKDSGSLTVIAAAREPIGGETTVIAFDTGLASAHRFPSIDLRHSAVLWPELLVGEDGVKAIAKAVGKALR